MSVVICKNCGRENPESEKYCKDCRLELYDAISETPVVQQNQLVEEEIGEVKCPNCSNWFLANQILCPNCGINRQETKINSIAKNLNIENVAMEPIVVKDQLLEPEVLNEERKVISPEDERINQLEDRIAHLERIIEQSPFMKSDPLKLSFNIWFYLFRISIVILSLVLIIILIVKK